MPHGRRRARGCRRGRAATLPKEGARAPNRGRTRRSDARPVWSAFVSPPEPLAPPAAHPPKRAPCRAKPRTPPEPLAPPDAHPPKRASSRAKRRPHRRVTCAGLRSSRSFGASPTEADEASSRRRAPRAGPGRLPARSTHPWGPTPAETGRTLSGRSLRRTPPAEAGAVPRSGSSDGRTRRRATDRDAHHRRGYGAPRLGRPFASLATAGAVVRALPHRPTRCAQPIGDGSTPTCRTHGRSHTSVHGEAGSPRTSRSRGPATHRDEARHGLRSHAAAAAFDRGRPTRRRVGPRSAGRRRSPPVTVEQAPPSRWWAPEGTRPGDHRHQHPAGARDGEDEPRTIRQFRRSLELRHRRRTVPSARAPGRGHRQRARPPLAGLRARVRGGEPPRSRRSRSRSDERGVGVQ
jgi:hypothetical protein